MTPHTPTQWSLTLITIALALYGFASVLDDVLVLVGRAG